MPLLYNIVECPRVFVGAFPVGEERVLTVLILGCPIVLDQSPSLFPKGLVRVRDKGNLRNLGVGMVEIRDGVLEQKYVLGSNGSTLSRSSRCFAVLLVKMDKVIASIFAVDVYYVLF